jgi:putative SOS response-associated peptidase YedK
MCGRYELHTHPAAIALAFALPHAPSFEPSYNIAPMSDVPVVRIGADGRRELVRMRWGFVPRWAKDPSIGNRMINARGETLPDKPTFRMAFRRHRCLLPADGFYEWHALPGPPGEPARKQPLHIGMKDGEPFGLAGLFERWMSPDGEVLDTCTIVTTEANALLAPVHDRMPLIVPREHFARWLDPRKGDVRDLVVPYPAERMTHYPVSTRVNSVRHDDPKIIECVEPMTPHADVAQQREIEREPEQESLF